MDTAGEWRRQKAIAEQTATGGAYSSRMHRFMPPPATYDTPTEATSDTNGLTEYSLLGDDVIDSYATHNGMDTQRRYQTDDELEQKLFDDQYQMNQTNESHHMQYAAYGGNMLTTPSAWTPAARASHTVPSSSEYFPHIHESSSHQMDESNHLPPDENQNRNDESVPVASSSSSRKRARTSNSSDVSSGRSSNHSSDDGNGTTEDTSIGAADTGRSQSRSRKKFSKAHQTAVNRQFVPTLTVKHHVVPELDEEMEQEQQPPIASSTALPSVSENDDTSYSLPPAAVSATTELHHPSAPSSPCGSSVSSGVSSTAASLKWTHPQKGKKMNVSPNRRDPRPAASSHPAPPASSTVWQTQPAPPPPPVLTTPKPLAQTGALWIQQFSKTALPRFTKQEVDERVMMLQDQVLKSTGESDSMINPSLMPLTPIFFVMGLSLLIRQPSLTKVQADKLAELCHTMVTHRLVPAGLIVRIVEHLRDFAKRVDSATSANLNLLADTLGKNDSNAASPSGVIVPSGVMHAGRFSTPASSSAHHRPAQEEFHMIGSHSHSSLFQHDRTRRPTPCQLCGLSIIGSIATIQAHMKLCAEQKRQEESKERAAINVGATTSDHLQKRYPPLHSSFVLNTPSSSSSPPAAATSSNRPAAAKTSGTSFSDAISIGSDDDTDECTPNVASIASKQRLSLDAALAFVKASFAVDDLIHSQKLPLVDPLTLTRIEVPVRSKNCSHIRCMDLSIMLQHAQDAQRRKHKLRCPICSIDLQIEELVVDSFLELRLKEAEAFPNISEITLHRDCSFDFQGQGGVSSAKASPSPTEVPAGAPQLARQGSDGKKRTTVVHHVDLLDDDDDEDDESNVAASDEAERKLAILQRRMAEKRPVSMVMGAHSSNRPSPLESDSDSSESDVSRPVSRSSLARSVDGDRSRTPSPLQHAGGFSSGEESSTSVQPTRNTIVIPRSLWNRPGLHLQRNGSEPIRPPAQLAPKRVASNQFSRSAEIDLTLSSDESEIQDAEDVQLLPQPSPSTTKVEQQDGAKFASVDPSASRIPIELSLPLPPPAPVDADFLLHHLGDAPTQSIIRPIDEILPSTTTLVTDDHPINMNVFSPEFMIGTTAASPIITRTTHLPTNDEPTTDSGDASITIIDHHLAQGDDGPVHPPSFGESINGTA